MRIGTLQAHNLGSPQDGQPQDWPVTCILLLFLAIEVFCSPTKDQITHVTAFHDSIPEIGRLPSVVWALRKDSTKKPRPLCKAQHVIMDLTNTNTYLFLNLILTATILRILDLSVVEAKDV